MSLCLSSVHAITAWLAELLKVSEQTGESEEIFCDNKGLQCLPQFPWGMAYGLQFPKVKENIIHREKLKKPNHEQSWDGKPRVP